MSRADGDWWTRRFLTRTLRRVGSVFVVAAGVSVVGTTGVTSWERRYLLWRHSHARTCAWVRVASVLCEGVVLVKTTVFPVKFYSDFGVPGSLEGQ